MSKPIVPEFLDIGFYASAQTAMGHNDGNHSRTEIIIAYDKEKNLYSDSFCFRASEEEIFIRCNGTIEGYALLSLFESIAEKLRSDIEENNKKN